jgi:hypothetical protein
LFSGQALWLGIKVSSDLEATPRQALMPVAYALSLVPGAAVTGTLTSPALRVANTGGPALVTSGTTTLGGNVTINGTLSGGTHNHDGAAITTGAVADARIDAALARDAEVASSYYNKTEADNRFVNTTGPEFMSANSSVAALAVSQSGTGMAGFFTSTATYGVRGETGSTTFGQAGVLGAAGSATSLNRVSGVLGNSTNGFGVAGVSTNHYGVVGFSNNSIGVRGEAAAGSSAGVSGASWGTGPGVSGVGYGGGEGGSFSSTSGTGLYATSSSIGVWGNSTGSAGVYGVGPDDWGVYGNSTNGYALYGYSGNGYGLYARTYTTTRYAGYFYNGGGSGVNRGVGIAAFTGNGSSSDTHPGGQYYKAAGEFSGPVGIIAATSPDSSGGDAIHAVAGSSTGLWALRATKTGGGDYAGYFTGNVFVVGNLSASGTKPFKIDNPLNPANEYLYHYAVESPEVQNMYNGTLVLDDNGAAVVTLPDYFSAINTGDYRYSLTPIGAPMPNLYVAEEIKGNTFKIAGGAAGMKVSWVVYGQRNDAWMQDHPASDIVAKPAEERGTYLYPQGYDLPESLSLSASHDRVLNYTPLPLIEPARTPLSATLPVNAGGATLPIGPVQPSNLIEP